MEGFVILPLELFKKTINVLNCSIVLLRRERGFKGLTDDLVEFLMALLLYDL